MERLDGDTESSAVPAEGASRKRLLQEGDDDGRPNKVEAQDDTADGSGDHEVRALVYSSSVNLVEVKKTRREEKILDFLIVGAQKAGTMAAVRNLNKHPDIFVANEIHFFDLAWDRGVSWYKEQLRSDKAVIGEKTPELMYIDECAVRMKQVCPDSKFIMFLRDPVKRAYSSWNMQRSRGWELLTFGECVTRELGSDITPGMIGEKRSFGTSEYHYLQKGFYMDQIERFLRVFPDRSKLLIVIAEKIQRNPAEEYSKIFSFLGVRDLAIQAEDHHLGSYTKEMPKKTEKKLRELFRPHNQRLFQFLGYDIPEWEPADS